MVCGYNTLFICIIIKIYNKNPRADNPTSNYYYSNNIIIYYLTEGYKNLYKKQQPSSHYDFMQRHY